MKALTPGPSPTEDRGRGGMVDELGTLVGTCALYFERLGIHPGWVNRWCVLSEDERKNARGAIDNWLEHYLEACRCLRAEPVDADWARDLAGRWPSQLLHYAGMEDDNVVGERNTGVGGGGDAGRPGDDGRAG